MGGGTMITIQTKDDGNSGDDSNDEDDNQTVTTMDTTVPAMSAYGDDNHKKLKHRKYKKKETRGNAMSDDEENVYEFVNKYNKPSSPLTREAKMKTRKDNDNPMSPSSLETPQPHSIKNNHNIISPSADAEPMSVTVSPET